MADASARLLPDSDDIASEYWPWARMSRISRVDRLLRAHDATLPHLTRAVVHQLTTRGTVVDLTDLAWLILSDGRRDQERARRKVAREYYQALYRSRHSGDTD